MTEQNSSGSGGLPPRPTLAKAPKGTSVPDNRARADGLWRLADEDRRAGRRPSISRILEQARKTGVDFDVDDVRTLMLWYGKEVGMYYVPRSVAGFFEFAVAGRKVKTFCDPWAGAGLLAVQLIRQTRPNQAYVICDDASATKVAKALGRGLRIDWLEGDPLSQLEHVMEPLDLVASIPPMGAKMTTVLPLSLRGPLSVRDEAGFTIVFQSCRQLRADGLGVFVVPEAYVWASRHASTRDALRRNGLRLKAALSLPLQTFYPYTAVGTCLLLIENGEQGPLYVGQLTDDMERNRALFANMNRGVESAEPALGRLVDIDTYRGFAAIEVEERVLRLAKETGSRVVRLGDISEQVMLTKASELPGFHEHPNAIYVPLTGRSDVVSSLSELKLKPHNYVQVAIANASAEATYVAAFLNSSTGIYLREQACSGTASARMQKSMVGEILVLLPDRQTQLKSVEGRTRVAGLISELRGLEQRIWSEPTRVDAHLQRLNELGEGRLVPVARHEDNTASKVTVSASRTKGFASLPFPLAYPYRLLGPIDAPAERYQELMRVCENTLAYLASVGLAMAARFVPKEMVGHLHLGQDTLRKYWRGGISPGDWVTIGRESARILRSRTTSTAAEAYAGIWFRGTGSKQSDFGELVGNMATAINNFKHGRGPRVEPEHRCEGDKADGNLRAVLDRMSFLAQYPLRLVLASDVDWQTNRNVLKTTLYMGDHPAMDLESVEHEKPLPKDKLYMQLERNEWVSMHPLLSVQYCPTCHVRETYLLDYWAGPTEKTVLKSFERGHTIDLASGAEEATGLGPDLTAWMRSLFGV